MTRAEISPLSPWDWLWDSSSTPVFACALHAACCSPLSEGHPRGTTPFVSQPVCCLCFSPPWFPTCRQVLGHLLYPEDGRQPGAEALCREKTGGAHITPRSLLPGLCHVAVPHQAAWPPRKAGGPPGEHKSSPQPRDAQKIHRTGISATAFASCHYSRCPSGRSRRSWRRR